MNFGERPFKLLDRLPSEHGFWVMLGAAQASALLRTRGTWQSVIAALWLFGAIVLAASSSHERVRKSSAAQLGSSAALALSSVPVKLAGALPIAGVASAGLARVLVFLASALVVRGAFARSARGRERRSLLL